MGAECTLSIKCITILRRDRRADEWDGANQLPFPTGGSGALYFLSLTLSAVRQLVGCFILMLHDVISVLVGWKVQGSMQG